jgi:BlaI family transcriptional regulator, penicillinase repressor
VLVRIKRRQITISEGLSEVEANIMNSAWREGATTVRDVHELLLSDGYIPYTSVMAIMNGLVSKGLLRQDKTARTYAYTPCIGREELAAVVVDAVVQRILGGDKRPILEHLQG